MTPLRKSPVATRAPQAHTSIILPPSCQHISQLRLSLSFLLRRRNTEDHPSESFSLSPARGYPRKGQFQNRFQPEHLLHNTHTQFGEEETSDDDGGEKFISTRYLLQQTFSQVGNAAAAKKRNKVTFTTVRVLYTQRDCNASTTNGYCSMCVSVCGAIAVRST